MSEPILPPLILTLKMDAIAFDHLNALRQQHFPPERNFLPAHITLFHQLPGEHEAIIVEELRSLCTQTPVLPLEFSRLRFLGRGVAIEAECLALVNLHKRLADLWKPWLSRQDQQRFQPHVTIQNKVTGEAARSLYDQLQGEWRSFEGQGEGLLLWQYRGGPWSLVSEFTFSRISASKSS